MTRRRAAMIGGIAAVAIGAGWVLFVGLPRWYGPKPPAQQGAGATPGTAAAAERKITATLYYISEDGMSLVGAQREVAFGDPIVEQARRIVEAQLVEAPAPLASAVPQGTTLRAVYISERGDAFVDLTGEVTSRHSGGALDELFTVYAIVNALTVNLPAITRVQILVDGKEVDTLAGHVDLRHPLQQNLKWVRTDKEGT
jgi:Sporulation and spore germination